MRRKSSTCPPWTKLLTNAFVTMVFRKYKPKCTKLVVEPKVLRQALDSISLSEYPGGSPEFDDSGFRVESRRQLRHL